MSNHDSPPMPQPTAEHRLLQEHAGTWKVDCTFYMDPGEPPLQSSATERVDMIGEFWTVSRFENEIMGTRFSGCATLGFEPHTNEFVSTWVDSMSPVLCTLRGKQKGDTIALAGSFWSCVTGTVLKHRTTERHVSKDERVFEMFAVMPDGKEVKMMTNRYRRA